MNRISRISPLLLLLICFASVSAQQTTTPDNVSPSLDQSKTVDTTTQSNAKELSAVSALAADEESRDSNSRQEPFKISCTAELARLGETLTVDVGRVPVNRPVQVLIQLKNKAGSPLRIAETDSDCGCVTTAVKGNLVVDGEVFEITVDINPTPHIGGLARQLRLFFEDHGADPVRVNVVGRMTGSVEFEVNQLSFKSNAERKLVAGTLHDEVEVVEVYTRSAFLKVEDWTVTDKTLTVEVTPRTGFGNGLERLGLKLKKGDATINEEFLLACDFAAAIKFSPSEIRVSKDGEFSSARILMIESKPGTIPQENLEFSVSLADKITKLNPPEISCQRIGNRIIEIALRTKSDFSGAGTFTLKDLTGGAEFSTSIVFDK